MGNGTLRGGWDGMEDGKEKQKEDDGFMDDTER